MEPVAALVTFHPRLSDLLVKLALQQRSLRNGFNSWYIVIKSRRQAPVALLAPDKTAVCGNVVHGVLFDALATGSRVTEKTGRLKLQALVATELAERAATKSALVLALAITLKTHTQNAYINKANEFIMTMPRMTLPPCWLFPPSSSHLLQTQSGALEQP